MLGASGIVVMSGVSGVPGVVEAPGVGVAALVTGAEAEVGSAVGVALTPPMTEVADGLTPRAAGMVAAAFVAPSLTPPPMSSRGSASVVPGTPLPGPGTIRTMLSAPAASASPPTANSTLRDRGLR